MAWWNMGDVTPQPASAQPSGKSGGLLRKRRHLECRRLGRNNLPVPQRGLASQQWRVRWRQPNTYGYVYSDSDSDCHIHAYGDCHRYVHSDRNGNGYRNTYGNSYDRAAGNADTASASDACAASGQLLLG